MIKIIIFTHGNLSQGLVSAVEVIAGKIPNCTTLSLTLEDNPDKLSSKLSGLLDDAQKDEQILIINDIFGGTPSNLSLICAKLHPDKTVKVISGVNLAMLLELVNKIGVIDDIQSLAQQCLEAAKLGIIDSSMKVRK